jgi:hypothetical protein
MQGEPGSVEQCECDWETDKIHISNVDRDFDVVKREFTEIPNLAIVWIGGIVD